MTKSIYKVFFIYFSLCIFGIINGLSGFNEQYFTVWDKLYFIFYGVTEQGFSITTFFYYCIVYIGIVYMFQIYLSIILTERINYQLIRYRSLYRWFWALIKPIIFGVITLLLLLFCITIMVGILEGKNVEFTLTVVDESSAPMLIYHFFVNGFLQIMNYILIAFLIIWVWKESEFNLLTLIVLTVTSLPIINSKKWIPSGLNSLGYVNGNEYELYKITCLLLVYLIIEMGIILYLFKKRRVTI